MKRRRIVNWLCFTFVPKYRRALRERRSFIERVSK